MVTPLEEDGQVAGLLQLDLPAGPPPAPAPPWKLLLVPVLLAAFWALAAKLQGRAWLAWALSAGLLLLPR